MTTLFRRTLVAAFRPRAPLLARAYTTPPIHNTIGTLIKHAPVVLFMKGTPDAPQCGFSRATIQILSLQGVDPKKFAAVNVLEDQEIREGIKSFSDWPTIPQLYVNGEFVGGCDIVVGMHQSGELEKVLGEAGVVVEEIEDAGEGAAAEGETAEKEQK